MSTPESEDKRAAALFDAGRRLPERLSRAQLARIEQGITARLGRRRLPTWLRTLLGTGALLGGSLVFAAVWNQRPRVVEPHVARTRPIAAPLPPSVEPSSDEAPGAPSTLLEVAPPTHNPVQDSPAAVDPVETQTRTADEPTRTPAPKTTTSSSTSSHASGSLMAEAKLLQQAVQALRTQKDPAAALALLARHRRTYPAGQLMTEAQRTRIEAHVALGELDEALRTVRTLRREAGAAGQEWWVLEGELLTRMGRHREALVAFDRTLALPGGAVTRALLERAWNGRVTCHSALGNEAQAREDAAQYLAQYPDGRFAGTFRALLDGAGAANP